MFTSLYFYYFKKVIKTCCFIQIVFCIMLSMHQIPLIVIRMHGFNFGAKNLFILLGLSLLKFFSLITILSCVFSIIFHLSNDFIFSNMKVFFIQSSLTSFKLFKILFLLCGFYGYILILNDSLIVPKIDIFFKQKILEIYKEKIFYSIKPKHIVYIPEASLNVSIVKREDNVLLGCLIHSELYNIFVLLQSLTFQKDALLRLSLKGLVGKLDLMDQVLCFECEEGEINLNQDFLIIPDFESGYSIGNIRMLLDKWKVFLISLLIVFLVFFLIFSNFILNKIILTMIYFVLLFSAFEFMNLHLYVFIGLSFILIISGIRVLKCLDF